MSARLEAFLDQLYFWAATVAVSAITAYLATILLKGR